MRFMSQVYCAKNVQLLKISKVTYLVVPSDVPSVPSDVPREKDNKFPGQSLLCPDVFQKRIY